MKRKRRGLFRKGSVTVYLCLILLVMLSLISAALYSARLSAGRAALACAEEQGLYSMFSQYDQVLFEKYGLLFLDAGYGGEDLQLGRVLRQTESDASLVLHPTQGSITPGAVDLVRFGEVKGSLTGYVLATDNQGTAFRRQVCESMRSTLGNAVLETLKQHMGEAGEAGSSITKQSDSLTDEQVEGYLAADRQKREEQTETAPVQASPAEPAVNPIETVKALKKRGIMALVLPGDRLLSAYTLDTGELVSRRNLQTGMNMVPSAWEEGDEAFLMREFLIRNYPCFASQGEEGGLQYQAEYALVGKDSDEENLKTVVRKLRRLREQADFLYLAGSPERRAEASEMALAIAASMGNPELEPVISLALLKCWAWGESILDMRELLEGGKIPLVKTDGSWQLSLSSLADLQRAADTERHSADGGLNYEEYLRLLLARVPADILAGRMMDLTELNVREAYPGEHFCLDCCLDAAGVRLDTSVGRQKMSISRYYGYRNQRKGLFY